MKQRTAFALIVDQALARNLIDGYHIKWKEISQEARDFVLNTMMDMFKKGEIDFKDQEKILDDIYLKKYCQNVVNDNLIKVEKFNGGIKYEAKKKKESGISEVKIKREILTIEKMLKEGPKKIGNITISEESLYSLRLHKEDLEGQLAKIQNNRKMGLQEQALLRIAEEKYGEEAVLMVSTKEE